MVIRRPYGRKKGAGLAPLIGRRQELSYLEEIIEDALAGVPHVVFVSGEAGIGKSRILREARSIARQQQFEARAGRAFENMEAPYLPFSRALAPLLDVVELDADAALRRKVGLIRRLVEPSSASERHISGVRCSFVDEHDAERHQLFEAIEYLLCHAARLRPTLITLDDLHWADGSSLDLLCHLIVAITARSEVEPIPLAIICAHRAVQEGQPLCAALSRIGREEVVSAIELSGLDESGIADMIRSLGIERPSPPLLRELRALTLGNPLFVEEALYSLRRCGWVEAWLEDGKPPASLISLPADVTSALAARIAELSDNSRYLMTLASCLRDEFTISSLARISESKDASVRAALDEAERKRIAVGDGKVYRFEHPLIQHLLYASLDTINRNRLHLQIAEMLSAGPDSAEQALEIAHHILGAGSLVEAHRVVEAARRAGERALSIYAWSEAARYLAAATEAAQTIECTTDAERAELHHQLAFACFRAMDVDRAALHYRLARNSYDAARDERGSVIAEMEWVRLHVTLASVAYGTMADVSGLEGALARLSAKDRVLRGHGLALLSQVYWTARNPEKAIACARSALDISKQSRDARLGCHAATGLALALSQTLELEEAIDAHRRAIAFAREVGDPWLESYGLHRLPLTLVWLGQVDEAEKLARCSPEHVRRSHEWAGASLALAARIASLVIRGQFRAAEELGDQVKLLVERSGYPWGGYNALPALASGLYLQGRAGEAERVLDRIVEPGFLFRDVGSTIQLAVWTYRQLLRARAGVSAEEREQLLLVLGGVAPPAVTEVGAVPSFCALGEIAGLLNAPDVTEAPYQALSYAWSRGLVFTTAWVFLVPRVLGALLILRGETKAAAALLRKAATIATDLGAGPELALTRLAEARLLTKIGRVEHARQMARRSLEGFEQLRMESYSREARAFLEELGHSSSPPSAYRVPPWVREDAPGSSPPGSHVPLADDRVEPAAVLASLEDVSLPRIETPMQVPTSPDRSRRRGRAFPLIVIMTDMVDSTAMLHKLGEHRAQKVMHAHNDIIRSCLREFGAREVRFTGDGFLVTHTSAIRALQCSMAIQDETARYGACPGNDPIPVRIGIDTGEILLDEGDLFGRAVNCTARLCAAAAAGQILTSEKLVTLAGRSNFRFVSIGMSILKGFAEPVATYEVQPTVKDKKKGARLPRIDHD
jgi:class 3 adenylate cyclase/tetratricopeptide (TPR) repeat protein